MNAIETTVRKVRKVVILVLVWLSFVLAALAAIPLSLLYLTERPYGRNVLLSMDRVMAAVLGWSGMYTVSAQCGKSACLLCRVVCWLLNRIDPNHCQDAASGEGV
jgi:hypothetical protein